ncbi:MAG TPA: Gfo/Idh/MocA family oxidoreductase [Acetobacteraceae bacterium]|jgi:predicted dehydrogenase|nr:Gfo/Idh/MocA family oxidoreductase [Acetobacteraceae bacterium]
MSVRFACIGLDHRHIYDLAAHLIAEGASCAGYCPETSDPGVLDGFRRRFPQIEAVDRARLLDDPSIGVIVTAAVPRDRAGIAIEAMRRGKDIMSDKPGVISADQLDDVERAVADTGRIFSVCFSERFLTPSTEEALRLVRAGAIGRVVQTVGLGPHRLNRALRPDWFWDASAYGGILVDIASHQIDQFVIFADSVRPEVVHASVGQFGTAPGFDDFGEILLRSESATGYLRVDWFTPDGLPTWGDGRLTVLGTEGFIELRKYVDIGGRPGTDHLFLSDTEGTRHIACEGKPLSYFRAFLADVEHRTETAMPQSHVFMVSRLAVEAQAKAVRVP